MKNSCNNIHLPSEDKGQDRPIQQSDDESLIKILIIESCGETYGIPVTKISEIVRPGIVTRIPGASEFILGATNLRGRVIPVIDLAFCMKNIKTPTTDHSRFLVITHKNESAALYVDRVFNIDNYSTSSLLAVPDDLYSPDKGMIGVVKKNNRLTILLDPNELIDNFISENKNGTDN